MAGFKRKVFYVGGFDPRGVRFYHALMAEQVARYAKHAAEDVAISTRRNVSSSRTDWTIANRTTGAETDYSFLRWEDIVRTAWIRNPLRLAGHVWRAYRGYWRELDFETGKKLGRGPLVTLFFPPVATVLLPLILGLVAFGMMTIFLPWWIALPAGLAAGVAGAAPLLRKAHALWLLRFFVFNAEIGSGDENAAIGRRLDTFADEIAQTLGGPWDEILLVTHSNGSILAVPLMVRLLELRAMPANFALVTMGHCIPLVACRRDATRFHEQLRTLARHDFRWIDIGSPPDGAAYFGVDPMKLVTPDVRPAMELLSPRFHLFYDPETYHKGYANKYEIHFDYLRTGDRLSPIDYPSLMAAARPIEASVAAFRSI